MEGSIEEKIYKYWASKTKLVDLKEERLCNQIFERIEEQRFIDPTTNKRYHGVCSLA
jgi:hypothetical protein